MIACGYYKPGDTITLEIAWQYNSDISNYHDYITKYILDAWNAANTGLNLRFDYWIGGVWSDVYYEKMLKGQFDIAFGNISYNLD